MSQNDVPAIGDAQALLRRVADLIASAKTMPLSSSVMVNREELLELIEEAQNRLPDELRQARMMLRDRTEFLAKTKREGDDILDASRAQAERMVQRTEVVRAAEARARQILESAADESRRLRNEVEDFCDRRLASFEIVLDRVQKTVAAGRERLNLGAAKAQEPEAEDSATPSVFFDQDRG